MAKPILVIKTRKDADYIEYTTTKNAAENALGKDYHVIVTSSESKEYSFECFNDCKGLKDVDIEKLIKDFNNERKIN
jgi:hypothetical protein